MLEGGQLTVHGTYIREQQNLHATFAEGNSSNQTNELNTFRLDTSYGVNRWELTGGIFSMTGSRDTGLYASGEINGSAAGSPDSRGWISQLPYYPWQNVQLLLQYTAYEKFNSRSKGNPP